MKIVKTKFNIKQNEISKFLCHLTSTCLLFSFNNIKIKYKYITKISEIKFNKYKVNN